VVEDEEVVAEDEAAVDVRSTKISTKYFNRSLISPWTIKTVLYLTLRSQFMFHSFHTHQQ